MTAFDHSGGDQPRRKRRPRYSGTHPKSYAQKYKEQNLPAYPEMKAHLRAKGTTPAGTHVPVLVEEVMACLKPRPGDIVVDCTVGYGGHAAEFIRRIGPMGRLIALDVDAAELERTRQRLSKEGVPVSFHRSNFAGIAKVLRQENLDGCDIIFADLGVSSMQVDNPDRGMSYRHEGPLDLRMDDRIKQTGADLLNSLSEAQLSAALWELADEPDHQKIARMIVAQRAEQPIMQTSQLVQVVFDAKGLDPKTWRRQHNVARASRPCSFTQEPSDIPRQTRPGEHVPPRKDKARMASPHGSLHPAARTFQALRILVNDELGVLRELLRIAPYCLRPGGQIGIISFHSGEDRLVKQSFREGVRTGAYESASEDVIVPQSEETRANPRSASAKFRWATKALQSLDSDR
jgi:16S rRNA (cytosine1402-N4)-methyltransferase